MLYSLTELNFDLTLPSSALRLLIEVEGEACMNKKKSMERTVETRLCIVLSKS
jgi:hypothetical protein